MYLKYLDVTGFKSFPDKTRLTFGRGLTAVVGPNGSGKSNISDAVRWVLGEQSTKALRGAKMEDVIFSGTAARAGHGFAEVRLTLDNADHALPVEAEEISITRKYYRTGESEYKINDRAARLKDVNELFMDTGLGRDGYSLIGQGRIAEIVGAKSKERREIFEEAAGISRFRYRKEEAERHLAAADENLLRLRDNLDMLEARVGPLREQSEKAKQFLEYSEEKKGLEISIWMRSLRRIKSQLQEQSGEIAGCEAEYERLDAAYGDGEERINALFERMNGVGDQVEARRGDISRYEAESAEAASRAAVCKNDIEHGENERRRIEGEIAELSSTGSETEAAIGQRRAELAAWEGEAVRLEEKRAKTEADAESLAAEGAGIDSRRAAATEGLAKTEAELAHLAAAEAAAASEAEQLEARLAQLDMTQSQKAGLLAQYKQELSDCRELLETLDDRLEGLANTRNGIAMKGGLRKKELAELTERRAKLTRDATAARDRAKLLSDLENSMEGFAQSVRFVLDRARAGALGGILEPVSKIISVDAGYSLAIETAAGAALQNVVTVDEEAAKRAIRMLKERNQGRVTFLPLTSVKGSALNEQGLEGAEGFVGYAYKLARYDARYDGVIKSILGRIVVAEELDSAVAIAKRFGYRFRVVTLDGQVVNAGGSLTGGSSARSAGLLSRRQEIDELAAKAAALEKTLAQTEGDFRRLSEELSALSADMLATESEQKAAAEDKIRAEGEHKRLTMQLADVVAAGEEADRQRAGIDEKLAAAKTKAENAAAGMEKLRAERQSRQEQLAAMAKEAEALADRTVENKAAAGEQSLAAAMLQKDMEAARLAIAQLLENSADREARIAAFKAQMEVTLREGERLSAEIKAAEDRREKLSEDVKAAQRDIETMYARRREFEAESTRERAAQKETVARREEASVALTKSRERLSALQKDYDGIIGQLYDEYEMTYSMAEAVAAPVEEPQKMNRRLSELRARIKALGSVNVAAIEEYKEVSGKYEFLKAQIGDVEKSRDELRELIRSLTGQMRTIFTDRFIQIAGHFAIVFRELFGGGEAKLTLSDPDDVLGSGIDIDVQPPGKKITNLASLSGGEQAFVAIAIYFAIMKVSPPPFCILDEIEAALDDANVNRYAEYLVRLSDATQFIAITHRRGTMEHADRLYGVTMQEEGVSKLLELSLDEVKDKA